MAVWALGLGLGALAFLAALRLPPAGVLAAWGTAAVLGLVFAWRAEPVLWEADAVVPAAPPRAEPEPQPETPPPVRPLLDPVPIAGGKFRMGSPAITEEEVAAYFAREYGDAIGGAFEQRNEHWLRWQAREQPPQRVRVSPFLIARTPVTRAQWRALLPEAPKEWSEQADNGDLPATHVDWPQSLAFCNALSAREGLPPCYRQDKQGDWHWDRTADGYRLPTEAEWEYACRAGTETRWFWGEDPAGADHHAWYRGNSDISLEAVGGKSAIPWGLHDMAGLVYEWCWDRHGPYPAETDPPPLDPRGADNGDWRVVRGDSFGGPPFALRPAVRAFLLPDVRYASLGLRCIRSRARQH